MFVDSGHDTEVRLTLEAVVDAVNTFADVDTGEHDVADLRALLTDHGFSRAPSASVASLGRAERRLRAIAPHVSALATASIESAIDWINTALAELELTPSLTTHDDAGLHIHWTRDHDTFDDQVIADVLMALAQELADHGTTRFGICAADGCDHVFYDTTRNGSRRFCADPRCASRTHTADHRARRRS
jgi:predicted RNA-binding Zn ribbon-like protein